MILHKMEAFALSLCSYPTIRQTILSLTILTTVTLLSPSIGQTQGLIETIYFPVATITQSCPTVPFSNSLEAYYSFNDNAYDSSCNFNYMTVVGATKTSDRHGNEDSAYFFNGNDYMVSDFSPFSQSAEERAYSISFWFKPSLSDYGIGTLIHQGARNACQYEPLIQTRSSNDTVRAIMSGCGGSGIIEDGHSLDPELWHHAAIVVGSQVQQFYIDGELVTTGNIPPRYDVNYKVFIGVISDDGNNPSTRDTARYYVGSIDEVRIYSRMLSADEVAELYNLE